MAIKNYSKAFVLLGIVLLASCGFHLRGAVDMPHWLNKIAVISQDKQRALEVMLNNQIESYGITVYRDTALAKYWLILENETFTQQIISVSASASPRQYVLTYQVHFILQEANGKVLIPSNIISVIREVTINNNRILGSNYEESLTKNEMRREAVFLILDRISKKKA